MLGHNTAYNLLLCVNEGSTLVQQLSQMTLKQMSPNEGTGTTDKQLP